jgi:hypothetical protein
LDKWTDRKRDRYGQTDSWTNIGWTERQLDKHNNGRTVGETYRQEDRQVVIQTYIQKDRQVDGQTDIRWTKRQLHKQTDRKIDR